MLSQQILTAKCHKHPPPSPILYTQQPNPNLKHMKKEKKQIIYLYPKHCTILAHTKTETNWAQASFALYTIHNHIITDWLY